MNLTESREFIDGLVSRAVTQWWKAQCAKTYARMYLYYKPSQMTIAGDVIVVDDDDEAPSGYILARNEALSSAWTKEQCANVVRQTLRRLPILPI